MELKTCRACNQVKSLTSYHKGVKGRVLARCKICVSQKRLITLYGKESPKFTEHIRLNKIKVEDYRKTYNLLEEMGYNPKEYIHLQFCEKYGFTPNIPIKEFNNRISYENCFDF